MSSKVGNSHICPSAGFGQTSSPATRYYSLALCMLFRYLNRAVNRQPGFRRGGLVEHLQVVEARRLFEPGWTPKRSGDAKREFTARPDARQEPTAHHHAKRMQIFRVGCWSKRCRDARQESTTIGGIGGVAESGETGLVDSRSVIPHNSQAGAINAKYLRKPR